MALSATMVGHVGQQMKLIWNTHVTVTENIPADIANSAKFCRALARTVLCTHVTPANHYRVSQT